MKFLIMVRKKNTEESALIICDCRETVYVGGGIKQEVRISKGYLKRTEREVSFS